MRNLLLILALTITSGVLYSQSKKNQIEQLQYTADSLNRVLNAERNLNIKKEIEFIGQISSLQTELNTLNLQSNSLNKTIKLLESKLLQQEEVKMEKDILLNDLQSNIRLLSDSITKLIQDKKQSKVLNGDYINSENQICNISNHLINQEFNFTVEYGVNDEWGCLLNFEGTAKIMINADLDNNNIVTYYVGEYDNPYLTFDFTNGNILDLYIGWEASPDCSKFGDSQSETYTKFIKGNR
jgi:hypothetical protein